MAQLSTPRKGLRSILKTRNQRAVDYGRLMEDSEIPILRSSTDDSPPIVVNESSSSSSSQFLEMEPPSPVSVLAPSMMETSQDKITITQQDNDRSNVVTFQAETEEETEEHPIVDIPLEDTNKSSNSSNNNNNNDDDDSYHKDKIIIGTGNATEETTPVEKEQQQEVVAVDNEAPQAKESNNNNYYNNNETVSLGSALSGYYTTDFLETTKKAASDMMEQTTSLVQAAVASTNQANVEPTAVTIGENNSGNESATNCACADRFLETSKECMDKTKEYADSAYHSTTQAATNLIEVSSCAGKEFMESAAQTSEASVLSGKTSLEEASSKIEETYTCVLSEFREFVAHHKQLFEEHVVENEMVKKVCQHPYFNKTPKKPFIVEESENSPVLHVAIEVQMKEP